MNKPKIRHFLNLWTLGHYPHGSQHGEWSDDQKLTAIKAAGFHGFQGPASLILADLSAKYELTYLGLCDADAQNYRQRLNGFAPFRPLLINVQLRAHDTEPAEAVRVWIELEKAAADLGLQVDLEIHRDTCTETPEKTWKIAELYQERTGRPIHLNCDLSHLALVKHLNPPYAARLLERPDLIRHSRQIHLRPFNGHHCQIPVTDGRGQITPWATHWLDFVAELFACWQKGKSKEDTLWVCPELGALESGYWIPPFPDPWQDAQRARAEFDRLWLKAGR